MTDLIAGLRINISSTMTTGGSGFDGIDTARESRYELYMCTTSRSRSRGRFGEFLRRELVLFPSVRIRFT